MPHAPKLVLKNSDIKFNKVEFKYEQSEEQPEKLPLILKEILWLLLLDIAVLVKVL